MNPPRTSGARADFPYLFSAEAAEFRGWMFEGYAAESAGGSGFGSAENPGWGLPGGGGGEGSGDKVKVKSETRNPNDESNSNDEIRNGYRTALLAILAFAICSIAAAVRSRGFIESDGATHYIFARHAFEQPIYFVDIWGRPLCTALFSVPARLGGLVAVRFTSMLAAIGCADRGGDREGAGISISGAGADLHAWSAASVSPFILGID